MIFPNYNTIKANTQRSIKPFHEVIKGQSSKTRNMTTNDTKTNNSGRNKIPSLYKTCNENTHGKNSVRKINSNILKEGKEQAKTRSSNKGSLLEQDSLNDRRISEIDFKPKKT